MINENDLTSADKLTKEKTSKWKNFKIDNLNNEDDLNDEDDLNNEDNFNSEDIKWRN